MSAENRKIAEELSATYHSGPEASPSTLAILIEKALDEAEKRGRRDGLETHKAGCTLAFQRGADKWKALAEELFTEITIFHEDQEGVCTPSCLTLRLIKKAKEAGL